MKRYWIENYGCQMNKAESEALSVELEKQGWSGAASPQEAGLVVLNTCSVRRTAEERIWGRLGFFDHIRKQGSDFKLVLMGCMTERLKETIWEQAPQVDLLVGNFQKPDFLELLGNGKTGGQGAAAAHANLTAAGGYRFASLHSAGGFRAYLPIMHGCDNFCSYCIVPHVRGREVSRSPEAILTEINGLEARGVREITLLGQNVNSYRHPQDGEIRFPDLLERILPRLAGIEWVRFLTSHPKDLSERLIDVIAANPALCRHIHLPVQHGSDRILEQMNRGYSAGEYLRLVDAIRKRLPGVSLTTDLLIGFPGETDRDYQDTLRLVRGVMFSDAFTYRYNPREGTAAYALGDTVPDTIKQERLSGLIDLQRGITRRLKLDKLPLTARVLVESTSRKNPAELLARTESDEMVVFPGSPGMIGHFVTLEITSLKGNTYWGKEIA
jgi:tRNA-2-methylthio-N6-dimethylallyladenosine synthase